MRQRQIIEGAEREEKIEDWDKLKREAESSSINSTTSSNQLLGFRFIWLSKIHRCCFGEHSHAQIFVLLLIKRKYVKLLKYVNLYADFETTSNMKGFYNKYFWPQVDIQLFILVWVYVTERIPGFDVLSKWSLKRGF